MGEGGYDYPITWQAMQQGIQVRHLVKEDDWPCLIYVEGLSWARWNLPRAAVSLSPLEWARAGPHMFVRVRASR
jgi:hypothetical protein